MKKEPGHIERSWIEKKKEQMGGDFINTINPFYIKRDAIKIFKDIAYGNISVNKDHAKYFTNTTFLNALQEASIDNYVWHDATYTGLYHYINNLYQNNIPKGFEYLYDICNRHRRSKEAYTQLYYYLQYMLNDIKYNNGFGIETLLYNLSTILAGYKDAFNGDYYTINTSRRREERRPKDEEESSSSFFD